MPYSCAQNGHHFHEDDGAVFDRPRDLTQRGQIAVHCCHCAAVAHKTGYGERNPVTPNMVECGEYVVV